VNWILLHGYIPNTKLTDRVMLTVFSSRISGDFLPQSSEAHELLLDNSENLNWPAFLEAGSCNNYDYARWLVNKGVGAKVWVEESFEWNNVTLQEKYQLLFEKTGRSYNETVVGPELQQMRAYQFDMLMNVIDKGAVIGTAATNFVLRRFPDDRASDIINKPTCFSSLKSLVEGARPSVWMYTENDFKLKLSYTDIIMLTKIAKLYRGKDLVAKINSILAVDLEFRT
jgi:hypothetical protein